MRSTEEPNPVASAVVAACEEAWLAIQRHHPEVPDVVVVLGTGVQRGRWGKLGHWWEGQWLADGEIRGEVMLAGEALHLPAAGVFQVLLHEAGHGLNAARGIKDSSRGGRYHNERFRRAATEMGLTVSTMPPYGWAKTSLTPEAAARYRSEIAQLAHAMRIARRLATSTRISEVEQDNGEPAVDETRQQDPGSTKSGPAVCGCGRKLRMAPSVLAQGPVLCGLCGATFTVDREQAMSLAQHSGDLAPTELGARIERQAVEGMVRIAHTAAGVALLADVGAWRDAHRNGDPSPLIAPTAAGADAANEVARCLLKLDGSLSGPAIALAGREFMVGELVMVTDDSPDRIDIDGSRLPPVGVLGTVTVIDHALDEIEIDFSIAGVQRIAACSAAASAIEYGYAEIAPRVGAPLIDLRELPPLPDLTRDATETSTAEIELAH